MALASSTSHWCSPQGSVLDPAIHPGTQAPQQVKRAVIIRCIKARRHHKHIDIAPGIGFAGELRPEHHPEAHRYAVLLQSAQVVLDRDYNRRIKHANTSLARSA
jgi:hypothetical protein